MESTESLLEAIEDFKGAVVIVTHSEMILHALATRLIVFDDGKVTLFEGTYQDFLDRVGWKNEGEPVTAGGQAVNKKLLKRVRAELINEKSRTLGALQKSIDEVEGRIMSLEEKVEHDNNELLEASMKGDGEAIKKLSKAVHDAKAEIETLFAELERMHLERESRTKEFEDRLSATV
jgi:ATP-binding cassette subfamily F protein 3